MFWGNKKNPDPPRSAQAARPPLAKPNTPSAPASRPSWTPQPETNRSMTAQELPEMLLAHANVTPDQLRHAQDIQRQSGEFIGEVLVNEGVLDENSLVAFLAKYCKIPHLSLLDYLIDEKLLELIPPDFCMRHRLVPIDRMGRNLTVAMVNPLDSLALHSLHDGCPELRIKPILCTAKHFEAVAQRLFKKQCPERAAQETSARPPERQPQKEPCAQTARKPSADVIASASVDAALPQSPPPVSEPPIIAGSDLPITNGFQGLGLHNTTPTPEVDHQSALLDSVFSNASDDNQDDVPHPVLAEGGDEMTRQMTSAMVQSMRNTYDVLERRVRLFHGIAPEAIAKLFARGKTVEYEAGITIFRKGELGRYMFVILTGAVDIVDEDRHIAHLSQGEIFGEMALVSNAERSASAKTVNTTSLLMLSFDDITQDLENSTSMQLLVNITITLSGRLLKAQSR